jgi:hypothetical protein
MDFDATLDLYDNPHQVHTLMLLSCNVYGKDWPGSVSSAKEIKGIPVMYPLSNEDFKKQLEIGYGFSATYTIV